MTDKKITTSLRLPPDLHKELRHTALAMGVSMNQVIVARLRGAKCTTCHTGTAVICGSCLETAYDVARMNAKEELK